MVLTGLALVLALGGCAAGLDWTGAGLDGAGAALVLDRFGPVLEQGAVEVAGVLALDGGQCASNYAVGRWNVWRDISSIPN